MEAINKDMDDYDEHSLPASESAKRLKEQAGKKKSDKKVVLIERTPKAKDRANALAGVKI